MRSRLPLIVPSSEIDADATLVKHDSQSIVVVHPGQTFDSAAAAVWSVLREEYPHLHPDQVRSMLREAMPELLTMDDMIGLGVAPPRIERAPTVRRLSSSSPRRLRRLAVRRALIGAAAASLCVGAGWFAHDFDLQRKAATSQQINSPAYSSDPAFRQFAEAGRMRCEPVGLLRARCTDVDHLVMYSEAAISPSSVAYSFSYGSERIYVMVFPSPQHAAAWSAEDSTKESLPNLGVVDRFVLWGTDAPRLAEYRQLVVDASKKQAQSRAAGAITMPERLAALAFGTLGVSADRAASLEADAHESSTMLNAVQLVLGSSSGADDSEGGRVLADGVLVASVFGPVALQTGQPQAQEQPVAGTSLPPADAPASPSAGLRSSSPSGVASSAPSEPAFAPDTSSPPVAPLPGMEKAPDPDPGPSESVDPGRAPTADPSDSPSPGPTDTAAVARPSADASSASPRASMLVKRLHAWRSLRGRAR